MSEKLRWQTVSDSLARILRELMHIEELSKFRLVGGTSLCLQLGHRESYDIDMFTDQACDSVDWKAIDRVIRDNFKYVSDDTVGIPGVGITRFIGFSEEDSIKLDMYYTDPFIREAIIKEEIRLASIDDIAAMKLGIISTAGRKKDFWDLHEILETYNLKVLLGFFTGKYPYLEIQDVLNGMVDFDRAEKDIDPLCYKGKFWDLIKIDLESTVHEFIKE